MNLTKKVYTDAKVIEGGLLSYGGMVVGIKLSRPLKHGTIEVTTRPQRGDPAGSDGGTGAIVVRITQDNEVLFDENA